MLLYILVRSVLRSKQLHDGDKIVVSARGCVSVCKKRTGRWATKQPSQQKITPKHKSSTYQAFTETVGSNFNANKSQPERHALSSKIFPFIIDLHCFKQEECRRGSDARLALLKGPPFYERWPSSSRARALEGSITISGSPEMRRLGSWGILPTPPWRGSALVPSSVDS